MSEEPNTAPAAEPAAVPASEPAAVPQSFIEGDGTFKEGWEDAYLTEDQRVNARVAGGRVKSVQGLLDTVINSDKMISGDKILRPSDSFGDADWDAFHQAGGWTGEPIPITAPEGMEEFWGEDRAKKFSGLFNDLRLNPKQVAGLLKMYNDDYAEQLTDLTNDGETSAKELKANLMADWGNAYAQKKHNGDFAVNKGSQGDKEFQARVSGKFGNDPDFIRLMANLGEGFSESGVVPVPKQDLTPGDLQSKINDIMNSDAFMKAMHPEHKATMSKLRQLHIEKAKIPA